MATHKLTHIVLPNRPESRSFTSKPSRGNSQSVPQRNVKKHGESLQNQLRKAWQEAKQEQVVAHVTRSGVYLEFEGHPNIELITKSLEDIGSKQVRLLNVRQEKTGEKEETSVTYATIFVAHEKSEYFFKKIIDYIKKTTKTGQPQNAKLINSIANIRKALPINSFWQDLKELKPSNDPEWCEVWLSNDTPDVTQRFDDLLIQLNIHSKPGTIRFPERTIKLVHANRNQLEDITRLSDDIAEYRRAKTTANFWTELPNRDQAEWVSSLLERIQVDDKAEVSICILDTGINNGHPLLKSILADDDCQSVETDWGAYDHHKHGTLMAGVAGYGNLLQCLLGDHTVVLRHRLESVKILPPQSETAQELWGYVTAQAISRAEIQSPNRKRIICMAVSATDTRDNGRPSSWSAEIDQLTSGAVDDIQRLLIVCAGNFPPNDITVDGYPKDQLGYSIHDPAQSWNALTVGAYTDLDVITDKTFQGYKPLAPKGGLSPFTTTSHSWDNEWPIKPEVVFEGGNMAASNDHSDIEVTQCDDLSVLSTHYQPLSNHLTSFNMTSAATAQAAWFAAQIQATYPDFWPETIRGLMIHSADWPEALFQQFAGNGKKTTKTDMKRLLRTCGYGVPNLERALHSAVNSLTLISQAEIQPFEKRNSEYKTKDMHLYKLPWPKEELLRLPDSATVEMQITLSYFIEPGPGEIGWGNRYRYPSHMLQFNLNSPGESQDEFLRRINAAEENEDKNSSKTESPGSHWIIGSQARNKGSIHSDIWRGTAAELASSNLIGISPKVGWWRERHHLNKWKRRTRYALIVSISTQEQNVDLYTPIATQIGVRVPIEIQR